MAGPGIRYFEFAKSLSKNHEVTLLTPNESDIIAPFKIQTHAHLRKAIKDSEVIVVQQLTLKIAALITIYNKKIIIDAYDPQPLEHLEIFKRYPDPLRRNRHRAITEVTNLSLRMADGILCANELQRDLWLGLLMGLKKISPDRYDEDPSLLQYIGIVPFGLSNDTIKPLKGMREKFDIKPDDFVLLWGGGIWNWFDPLTLIRAIDQLKDPQIKLVFMGLKHPNEKVPEMKMASEAVKLVEKLGLTSQVFFNYGWTPYEERQAFLNESDVGVSTHLSHLETRYAFRTRILDYLWAGLPMLLTEGDSFSKLVLENGAGLVVSYENVGEAAQAIKTLKNDSALKKKMAAQSKALSDTFKWDKVVEPLNQMITRIVSKNGRKKPFIPLLKAGIRLRNPYAIYRSLQAARYGK